MKKTIKNIWRFPLKLKMKHKLKNRSFVLISSNCIGGCLLSDVGEPFNTPTINLVVSEFISFCEHLMDYLRETPAVYSMDKYPIMKLRDIFIHAIHYATVEDFLSAWSRRTNRFFKQVRNGAEILIMAADTQLWEINAKERFISLPYRKICFTSKKEWAKSKCFVYVPEFAGEDHVGDLTKYSGVSGIRIFEKCFDCVGFLNNAKREQR